MDLETKNGRQTKHGGGRAYRSRLESFVDFIRQQRQQRRTWQEIAAQLREKDCDMTFQGLHQFYRRYLKRQNRPHWETEAAVAQPATAKLPTPAHKPMLAATPNARPFRQPSPENINLNDPTKI
jgi:predicted metal-dependent phosphoesterase TrpH